MMATGTGKWNISAEMQDEEEVEEEGEEEGEEEYGRGNSKEQRLTPREQMGEKRKERAKVKGRKTGNGQAPKEEAAAG